MTTQDSGMPLLRLRSMYAESPEDDILFQVCIVFLFLANIMNV